MTDTPRPDHAAIERLCAMSDDRTRFAANHRFVELAAQTRALLAAHDAHAGEVEALREIVATLEQHVGERDARLHEVRDFLEDQFDVEDGDEGDVLPNWAMRAVNIIDQPWAERRTP